VFDVALHPFHPSPPLAVTGGEDDAAYLFETSTGRLVTKLSGHTDSVVCVGFSTSFQLSCARSSAEHHLTPRRSISLLAGPDGEFVASGGMDGQVRIWKRVGKESYGEWEFLLNLEGPDEVTVSCCSPPPLRNFLKRGLTLEAPRFNSA
jgi:ribosome assembly protein SQT1